MPFKPVPRLRTFDYLGIRRYFLTICVAGRAPIFITEERVGLVRSQLLRTSEVEHFAAIAYCFMPDHLHALVEGGREDCDFCRFVRVFKQCSAFHWKRRVGGDLWQRSYFEHVLRDDEDTFSVARYILENPVRAGLVMSPDAYPFQGSFTMQLRDLVYSVQIKRPT